MNKIPVYPISLEVSGPLAMFSDPASGSDSISYPLPPPSACVGMIESVCRIRDVSVEIVAVASATAPKWSDFTYNSFSQDRKPDLLKKDLACQIKETVLESPTFQILALLTNSKRIEKINNAHSMQEQFFRRLQRGQNFSQVSLGRREFLATYCGHIKTDWSENKKYSLKIPSMVMKVFEKNEVKIQVKQNLIVKDNVLTFGDEETTTENGYLEFKNEQFRNSIAKFVYNK